MAQGISTSIIKFQQHSTDIAWGRNWMYTPTGTPITCTYLYGIITIGRRELPRFPSPDIKPR